MLITPALDNILRLSPPADVVDLVHTLCAQVRESNISAIGATMEVFEDTPGRVWSRAVLAALMDDIKVNILFGREM